MEISREEWNDWKGNKVTEFLTEKLKELKDDRAAYLCNGGTLSSQSVGTEYIVGYIQGLNEFLNTEYEEREDYDH